MAPQIIVSQQPVAGFNMPAVDLLDRIDLITAIAERGAMLASQSPEIARLFREIGFLADATVADCGADLRAAWHLDQDPTPMIAPASESALQPAMFPAFGTYLPDEGGVFAGIMRAPDGSDAPVALIVAADQHEFKCAWGKRGTVVGGADSRTDGQANTAQMEAAGCIAARKVRTLRIGGFADWHLPSLLEMQIATGNVPSCFADNALYWTSTQTSEDLAMLLNLEFAAAAWDTKTCRHNVRPVRLTPLRQNIVRPAADDLS